MSGEGREDDREAQVSGQQDRRSEFLRSRGMADDDDFYRSSKANTSADEDSTPEAPLEQAPRPEHDDESMT